MNPRDIHLRHQVLFNLAGAIILAIGFYLIAVTPVAQVPVIYPSPTNRDQHAEEKPLTSTARQSIPSPSVVHQNSEVGQSSESPAPAKKIYKLTPVMPSSGRAAEYTINIQQCLRSGSEVTCWGYATNETDVAANLGSWKGQAVDDLGNSFYADARFPTLVQGTPTRYEITFSDPHPMARTATIQLDLQLNWNRHDAVTFNNVPIQAPE